MNNKKKQSILVIAVHPDDETLGCGATIKRLSKNNYIKLITFTDGETSRINSNLHGFPHKNRNFLLISKLKYLYF